jgi:hypothetical protein
MAQTVKKRPAAKPARGPRKQREAKNAAKTTTQIQTRSGTKQSTAIEMLRSPNGASIDALMSATGWQKHSARGFLAGVVRKRLKLNLNSTTVDGVRVYRVIDDCSEETTKAPVQRRSA